MRFKFIIFCLAWSVFSSAQNPFGKNPLVHTYSIVAIDANTGDMGVAVQSHWFSVGTLVTWGKAGVGVVATQSFVNPAFGPQGLNLMEMGFDAPDALQFLIDHDEGKDFRQVALLDANGKVSAFTGSLCIEAAGHHVGKGYSVQANLMDNSSVWPVMARKFEETAGMPLAERLLASLQAAEKAGGDIRGKQSAAILVVRANSTGKVWEDNLVDLRVDDHTNPLQELERLLKVHRAYEHMNRGDLAVEKGDIQSAMDAYGTAESMFPHNAEMKYWHAIALANAGKITEALPLFKQVFSMDQNWRKLTPRLIKNKLLVVSEESLADILRQ